MNLLQQLIQGLRSALQFWVTVAPWEKGIRVRLGKHIVVLEAGPHWRAPLLDRIWVHAIRKRISEASNQTATTRDGRAITFSLVVEWAIGDIKKLYLSISAPETTLILRAQAIASKYIATHDHLDLNPEMLAAAVSEQLAGTDWGFVELRAYVTTFCQAKPYRLLSQDYRSLSGLDLERDVTRLVS